MSLAKAVLMIRASMASDAATMPLHWIYDQSVVASKIAEDGQSTFHQPPSCPFYSYPFGVFSPYGDESLPLLRSLATADQFDHDSVCQEMFTFFSAYSETGEKGFAGRLNHVSKHFIAERSAGKEWTACAADDFQANGFAKVPAIVARYAQDPALESQIERMVRILQNNDQSVHASILVGRLLERLLVTSESPRQAIEFLATKAESDDSYNQYQKNILKFSATDDLLARWVHFSDLLRAAPTVPEHQQNAWRVPIILGKILSHLLNSATFSLDESVHHAKLEGHERDSVNHAYDAYLASKDAVPALSTDLNKVAASIGLSCALPGSLINSLLVMRKTSSLQDAIEANVKIGGDNCSRSMAIGAAFGAAGDAVPERWMFQMQANLWGEVGSIADKIARGNKHLN